MKNSTILAGVATALLLAVGSVQAADDMNGMEKCQVVKEGKGLIKAGKAACKTAAHSCAGENKDGDVDAWIMVPKGQCAKINAGDWTGVSEETKAKLDI